MNAIEAAACAAGIINIEDLKMVTIPPGKSTAEVVRELKASKPYLFSADVRGMDDEHYKAVRAAVIRDEPVRDYGDEVSRITGGKNAMELSEADYQKALRALTRS